MGAEACVKDSPQGALIMVLAVPRSSRTEIVDIQQERCRIKVKAPPVDGEANAALVEALAKIFGLSKRSVIQIRGQSGKQKTFLLSGLSKDEVCVVIDRIISEKGSGK
jgi:uncharacterized protein (TIGR00251 family)